MCYNLLTIFFILKFGGAPLVLSWHTTVLQQILWKTMSWGNKGQRSDRDNLAQNHWWWDAQHTTHLYMQTVRIPPCPHFFFLNCPVRCCKVCWVVLIYVQRHELKCCSATFIFKLNHKHKTVKENNKNNWSNEVSTQL